MTNKRLGGLFTAVCVMVLFAPHPLRAQTCDDGNACTTSDVCTDGTCTGTPATSGSCDDGNPCTVDDTCVNGTCKGTPMAGLTCGATGCEGSCDNFGLCVPDTLKQMQPCTDGFGDCTANDVCLGTICLGTFKQCADVDNNKCTREFCDVATGQCDLSVPVLCGACGQCNQNTGACDPTNEGVPCDDGNPCTSDGICTNGACMSGIAAGTATATFTPTPTSTPGQALATPTDTGTVSVSTPTDTPTGVPTGTASATETITPMQAATATLTPTDTPVGTPAGTATATPTGIPIGTATATITTTPSATGTPTPTEGGPTLTKTRTSTVTPTIPPAPTNTVTATFTASPTATPSPIVATIVVVSTSGEPSTTGTFDVTLQTTAQVAGTENDIAFDPQTRIAADSSGNPQCAVNAAIHKGATAFSFKPAGCMPGSTCTSIGAVVLAFDNLDPIPTGSVLYTCNVAIASDASVGSYPLTCSNPDAGDTNANRIGADCASGSIRVVIPIVVTSTPTATPSLTGTPATATPTSTAIITPGISPTNTRRSRQPADSDSCRIVTASDSRPGWALVLPAALLLGVRRRRP